MVPSGAVAEGRGTNAGETVLQFFHSATAYDIMPENGKVVVVDARLPLSEVLRLFVEQRLMCTVVWLEESGSSMLLTTSHLISISCNTPKRWSQLRWVPALLL